MINVLLAEDHNVVRNGIKSLLDSDVDLHVIAEAINGRQVLDVLKTGLHVDVILTDVNMPEINGIDLIKQIKIDYPNIKIVILSMLDHEKYITEAFKAGLSGYILKNVTSNELIYALKHIYYQNERYICHEISLRLLDKMINKPETFTPETASEIELSKREIEILVLIGEGYTNMEIADKLFTSKRTIEGHRQNLIDKTKSKNTAALIRYAFKNGLIA